jgi:hypothetical protein
LGAQSRALVIVAVSLAVLPTSCGGTEENASTPPSSVGKAEFVKRANAVCEQQRAGLMKEVSSYENLHSDDKVGSFVDAVHWVFLPAIDEEIAKLEELEAPPRDEKRIDAMLYAQKAALDSVAVLPAVASVAAAERRFAKSGRQLHAYGLSACALGL